MSGERPWTAFYGPSVRREIAAPRHRTLGDMVAGVAGRYGRARAFTCCLPNGMNGALSFAQVDAMSDALAVYLREVCGLGQGDRVALQVPNGLPFPVAAFGVFKAGCVLVNVNPLYTAAEMAAQFADAEPAALIVADMFAGKVREATQGRPIPSVIVTQVAEFLPAAPRGIVRLVQRYWDRSLPPIAFPHVRLPDALAAGRRLAGDVAVDTYRAPVGPDDVAVLQYTGGTTGTAKGAMLTHRNLLVNTEQTMEMIEGVEEGRETALTALPLYHVFAFTVNLLGFWSLGAHNVLIPNPRPLSNLKRAFENYPVTWMSGVNTLFNGLANEQWFRDTPPRHLKFAASGGMALQTSVAERWRAVTGTPLLQGYGLTETAPVLTFNPLGRAREGSIGIPVPGTEVACLDEAGAPVPTGAPGEIAARGPQVMAGYWRRPDETAKAMQDGWFLTGDVGVRDADGYFRVVDRKKDMIIVSGFNVYPNEVEDCLASHPGVAEVAVVGVPDVATGEAVEAHVVLRDRAVTPDALRAHARAQLTAYKVPKRVVLHDDLPKSNVGKILRKDVRATALAAAEARG
jgi:long-chain acyl-CoA synthetase